MLVDNPLLQPSFFSAASSQSSSSYSTDFSDIFDTDLFNTTFAGNNSSSSDSRESTPLTLLTPPQEVLSTSESFPDVHEDDTSNQFYALFDDDLKAINNPCASADFMGVNMGMNIPLTDDSMQMRGIDPQLVDTPSAVNDESDEEEPCSPSDIIEQPEQQEKLTFTIAPVKVGGFGKARKGTVQSGGIAKKTPSAYVSKEKEASSSPPRDREDDDDLPHDWRPSPEVLAKMTSKEKRQLRNKISARNFRVRRKEYITTLEGDIAERDRLLEHFRTQLGSQESENLALRQEIAALKKALLEGRGGPINLPPPAPLPAQSAAETLAASNPNISTTTPVQNSPLLMANTQKDLPTSPRMGGPRFWGGVGMGGSGSTPVHTTLVPDISTIVRNGLQENMNPALNAVHGPCGIRPNKALGLGGFDGFADLNPFTMKTLDAYRMHLWGKMAAQQQIHQNQTLQNHQNHSGLASNLRPHFFSASPKPNLPLSAGYGNTLSALLSGKHNISSSSTYSTPSVSSLLHPKGGASLPLPLLHPLYSSSSSSTTSINLSSSQKERERENTQQHHAMLAAMASQTVFRKLGNAFWDAFIGSPSSSSSPRGDWDAEKVRKVLEGKAVLRVVDVEPPATSSLSSSAVSSTLNNATPSPATPKVHHSWTGGARSTSSSSSNLPHGSEDSCRMSCKTAVCEMLEESLRSLSLGKKM